MKKARILIALVAIVIMVGCSKETDIVSKNGCPQKILSKESMESPEYEANVDSISRIICSIVTNREIMNQILIGVNKNLLFGMGEELRLRDILFPYESKIIDPEKEKDLFYITELFCKAFKVIPKSKIEDNMHNDLVSFIIKNEIEIYFPYSDKWDKNKLPLIVPVVYSQYGENKYDKRNPIAMNVKAYRLSDNEKLEALSIDKVDLDFLKFNPIFAIRSDRMSYDVLPEFNKGEFFSKETNTIWITRIKGLDEIDFGSKYELKPKWYNVKKHFYRIYLSNLSFHEFDGTWIFKNGPEVRFKSFIGYKSPDGTEEISTSSDYYREFTMDEVKEGIEAPSCWPLSWNWKPIPENSSLTVAFWEEDGGSNIDVPIDLSIANKFSLKTTLTIGSHDDFCGQIPQIERETYFVTCKVPIGSNGLTSDGFAYIWCGAAKFAIKFTVVDEDGNIVKQ